MSGTVSLDEVCDVLFDITLLQGQTNLLARLLQRLVQLCERFLIVGTYRIIANAYCRRNVRKTPEAALHEVYALFFEILKLLGDISIDSLGQRTTS